jgi:phage protein D
MGLGANITSNGAVAEDFMASGTVEYVEVHERLGETTYYTLAMRCDIQDDDISLISDSRLGPGADLGVVVEDAEGTQDCLVKGPVFAQEITLHNGGDGSSVLVKGADSSLKMDREFKSTTFEGTDSAFVSQVLGSYSLTPDVTTTSANHTEQKHVLVQRSTDLQFVKMLARRNGFKFWVTCDAEGIETAHFKRIDLTAEAAATLKINQEDYNITELRISWDAHLPSSAQGLQLDLANLENMTGTVATSPETPLGSTTLEAFAADAVSMDLSAPLDDTGALTARLEGAIIEASYFVQASCQTSLQQLGKVVRAASIVEIVGAGSQHSGKYLVAAVTHRIDESSHTMQLELMRNAIGPSA